MLKKLIDLLHLGATATEDEAITAVGALQSTANSNATALTTANSAKTDLETKLATASTDLATANGKVTEVTTERDGLKTQVSQLSTSNSTLVDGVLDLLEKAGKFTPAERPTVKARFTANVADSAAIITELTTKKPAVNTQHLEINGNRVDISTANARASALQGLVSKRMKDDECDYSTAYDRVTADPAHKQLVEAMKDPVRDAKKAA